MNIPHVHRDRRTPIRPRGLFDYIARALHRNHQYILADLAPRDEKRRNDELHSKYAWA